MVKSNTKPEFSVSLIAREKKLHSLLIQARQDHKAWQAFLSILTPMVRRWVKSKLYDSSAIEDVVQDILFAVYQKQASFDDSRELSPWLAAVARFKIMDYLRKTNQASYAQALGEDLDEAFLKDGTYSEPEEFYRQDAIKLINQMAEGRAKEAISAIALDHLTQEEAALKLQVSEGNFRVILHRATQTLMRLVSNEIKGKSNDK